MKIYRDRKLIVIYLSQSGCWAYTQAMINQMVDLSPLVISSQHHTEDFKDLEVRLFKTQASKTKLAVASINLKKKAKTILLELQLEYGELQLYFTAFHPWNLTFIQVAKELGQITTQTVHDYMTHPGEKSVLVESIQKKCIKLADEVIFLTKFVKEQAEKEMGSQENYRVLNHPLLPVSKVNELTHNPMLRLLFLGRIVEYKGLNILLEACSQVRNIQLTVAGEQLKNTDLINDTDNHRFLNRKLTDNEISELLASHHILVLPYTSASQSGILCLGVSAEIPMIITKVGGLPEQLPPAAAYWVESNTKSLAAAISDLQVNEEKYETIKQALISFKNNFPILSFSESN